MWLLKDPTMTSLEDEILLAHMWLLKDPTITTYEFVDGVELRMPASPIAFAAASIPGVVLREWLPGDDY